jgi:tRNA A-37 threonylcarbamoyl transferase component Bud32
LLAGSGVRLAPLWPVNRSQSAEDRVKYIAQLDFQSWASKRVLLGPKVSFFVTLDGVILTLFKNKSGPARHIVNVRDHPVVVSIPERELLLTIPGKDGKTRPLKLVVEDQICAKQWAGALEAALHSDIKDFYTLGKSIGSGAYGNVVEGFDIRTKEKYAVKIIQRGSNPKARQHLDQEMNVMKSVWHPGIVRTYHIFNLTRTIYIVMEHVPGGDLFDFIADQASLTEGQAVEAIRGILEAVDYLHRQGIVHRDLKPENILCVERKWPLRIKLTDFGFASFVDKGTMTTPVGVGVALIHIPLAAAFVS